MSSYNKLTCKGTSRPHFLLGFYLGWSINFVVSESGQIQNVIHSCRIWSPTGLNTPPPQPHTVCMYCTLTKARGGELNQREV